MDNNMILIVGLSANILTTVGGMVALFGKIEDRGKWQGWAETKIKANCSRLTAHGNKIDKHSEAIAHLEGD